MNYKLSSVTSKKVYCNKCSIGIMLIFSFIAEKIILDGINIMATENPPYLYTPARWGCLFFIIIYLFLFIFGWYKKYYRTNTIIMKKFLGYAVGLKFISLTIALSFLCQLTWFIDAAFPLIIGNLATGPISCKEACLIFAELGVIILFMFATFAMFYPLQIVNDKIKKYHLLVSGLSLKFLNGKTYITPQQLDLFTKPFTAKVKNGSEFKYTDIEKCLIVLSEDTFKSMLNDEVSNQSLKNYIPDAQIINEYNSAVEAYNNNPYDLNLKNHVKDLFEDILLLSIQTISQFYHSKKIEFYFTEEIDYDAFEKVFDTVSEDLKKLEVPNKGTLIHVSPGTAMVSSALTVFTIKKNRQLVYCHQKKRELQEATIDINTLYHILKDLWSEVEES